MNSTNAAPTCFREVAILMAAPLTDEEIEELWRQEPLLPNQGMNLPAEEPTEETK